MCPGRALREDYTCVSATKQNADQRLCKSVIITADVYGALPSVLSFSCTLSHVILTAAPQAAFRFVLRALGAGH